MCRAPAKDQGNARRRRSRRGRTPTPAPFRGGPPVTRLARFTGLPNQSPARLTAMPAASPTRNGGSRLFLSRRRPEAHRLEQRHRVGADEHHLVADRLDEPHGRDDDVAGQTGQPVGETLQLLRRHRFAQPGEADRSAKRTFTRARRQLSCRPLGALTASVSTSVEAATAACPRPAVRAAEGLRHQAPYALAICSSVAPGSITVPARVPHHLGGLRHPVSEQAGDRTAARGRIRRR